ncbi:hypothetical protein SAMN02745857_04328 [Andreprevotia lacus DSM 23236]|uniref:Uncharacterized protein n=2 Tax=Andreprevotia TaxID=397275 RepID=A0A1W1Y1H9_9NEIS|nr:hypothetical protein SAMN02745857_04328 [Andreprevotia lacus DSM 23236]
MAMCYSFVVSQTSGEGLAAYSDTGRPAILVKVVNLGAIADMASCPGYVAMTAAETRDAFIAQEIFSQPTPEQFTAAISAGLIAPLLCFVVARQFGEVINFFK